MKGTGGAVWEDLWIGTSQDGDAKSMGDFGVLRGDICGGNQSIGGEESLYI